MKQGICHIVGAGENFGLNLSLSPADYLIAADGGLRHMEAANLSPHLIIGDFDSSSPPPNHPNVVTLQREKDETDLFAALQAGIAQGYKRFHLHCATGGRIDHTMANLQLLTYLSRRGFSAHLLDQHSVITAVTDGTYTFDAGHKGTLSVLAADNTVSGVSLFGLKYPLDCVTLTSDFPLGISNEFLGVESCVAVEKGSLLLVYPRPNCQ